MHEPSEPLTPFPTLTLDVESMWEWPRPPFARSHIMTPLDGGAQPCRIETPAGSTIEGQLLHFDVDAGQLRFCPSGGSETLVIPFARIRRLTLTTPWPLAGRGTNEPVERVPTAVQERSYRIELSTGGELAGQTMGHVQAGGHFLFAPVDDGAAVLRVFVPLSACRSVAFGKSAEEQAAERWIATRDELFRALEAQKTAPIKPLGDALVDLGFVTRGVLERAVSQLSRDRDRPLGEELVKAGLLSRIDLKTALAHKMGYPLVDLSRFPVDAAATAKLSQRSMVDHTVYPLILDGERLIVAIDDLARVPKLQTLQALAGVKLVPVLASRAHIVIALGALAQKADTDHWAQNVPVHLQMPPTAPGDLGRR